ncbi:YqhG family protein [Brevibacillus dissolubilis]|uniref:YqhG family protein n=1 Tax=Brevibacillus dissolubilis TaxID=1844116 RepID=UPI00210028B8|nr:YqhG family protein [Brevibacillus dissolubilis]
MNQQEVRRFVEEYFTAFHSHVAESHPDYLSVKLTEEVDKDIGNRPFYWSWVERMGMQPQPMTLTFFFDAEKIPQGVRGEELHFGSGRMHQIFQSTYRHGRFVCMYEHNEAQQSRMLLSKNRSTPLTPWLNLNLKISFICDKKRDLILHVGINLHNPKLKIVHDFYTFLQQLNLSPAIPNYFYTLEQNLSVDQAANRAIDEVYRIIDEQDQAWADAARERLAEELEILEAYYTEMALREKEAAKEQEDGSDAETADADGASVKGNGKKKAVKSKKAKQSVEAVVDVGEDVDSVTADPVENAEAGEAGENVAVEESGVSASFFAPDSSRAIASAPSSTPANAPSLSSIPATATSPTSTRAIASSPAMTDGGTAGKRTTVSALLRGERPVGDQPVFSPQPILNPLPADTEAATELTGSTTVVGSGSPAVVGSDSTAQAPSQGTGGRILDFLRMNGIPEPTKVEELDEWVKSTPEEEKQRRMDELRWQYEPRIEVKLINGGLFYLHNMPPI